MRNEEHMYKLRKKLHVHCLKDFFKVIGMPIHFYRYKQYAKEAELQAIKGGFFYSVITGAMFFVSLGTFGVAFW